MFLDDVLGERAWAPKAWSWFWSKIGFGILFESRPRSRFGFESVGADSESPSAKPRSVTGVDLGSSSEVRRAITEGSSEGGSLLSRAFSFTGVLAGESTELAPHQEVGVN